MCLTSQKQEAAARVVRGSSAHCPAPTELCLQALSHSAAPLQLSLLRAGLTLHEPYGRQQYSSIPGGGRLLLDPACEILLLPCAAPWRLNSIQGLGREAGRKWVYFLSVAQQSIKYLQRDLLIAAAGMGGLCAQRGGGGGGGGGGAEQLLSPTASSQCGQGTEQPRGSQTSSAAAFGSREGQTEAGGRPELAHGISAIMQCVLFDLQKQRAARHAARLLRRGWSLAGNTRLCEKAVPGTPRAAPLQGRGCPSSHPIAGLHPKDFRLWL